MKKIISFLGACALTTSAFAWEQYNSPGQLNQGYQKNFKALPLNGELTLDKTPWSSSFWPGIYGGIAYRWNGYHKETPAFAPRHFRENELKDEIKKAKKELFNLANPSAYEVNQISKEIARLKKELKDNNTKRIAQYRKEFFSYPRVTKKQAMSMSEAQIAQLSPAEKYDLYKNNYSLKLTYKILNKKTSPANAYWEGICHGWSSAALEFHEPNPITVTNKDGIRIPFGSSDLKALLSFYHAAKTSHGRYNPLVKRVSFTRQLGRRCGVEFPEEAWSIVNGKEYYKSAVRAKDGSYSIVTNPLPPECVDTNPGAFHIVAANQLALMNQGFNAEMVRDREVWNQPVYKYDSKVVAELNSLTNNRTPGTRKQVQVKTKLYYANDGGRIFWGAEDPEDEFYAWWEQTTGTKNYRNAHKDLEYILDLDTNGNIIGGHWLSYERPDFIWMKKSKGFAKAGGIVGYLRALKNLSKIRK